jgi:hypothetical protein
MPDLTLTQAHRAARNAASIALADTGSGNSSIRLYDAPSGVLLAVRQLAKPCAVVRLADGRIELIQASVDDVVLQSGGAAWGEWCTGAGVTISAGHVTDASGNTTSAGATAPHPDGLGAFVIAGATGTQLYAGGIVRLAAALIG